MDEFHWIILDMGVSRTVEKIRLYVYNLGASQWYSVDVWVSDDPTSWPGPAAEWAVDLTDGVYGAAWVEDTLYNAQKGRYIRLRQIATLAGSGYILGAEFEAYLTG